MFLGERIVGAAGTLTDDDADAGVAQVLGMRVTLAAVTDDGDGLALQGLQIRILLVIDLHLYSLPRTRAAPSMLCRGCIL